MVKYIKDALLYSDESRLIFTEFYFWAFFGVVLTVYSIIYKKRGLRNAFLFGASIFFYYKTSGFFFTLLIFSTLADYAIGFRISKAQGNNRKIWLALSICINLFVLVFFKYAYFFTDSFNALFQTNWVPVNYFAQMSNSFFGSHFEAVKILLPVGISFYTFQTMSYAIDLYRDKLKPVKNVLDFGFYVSFFPQLVAGPIVRAADFIPQLYRDYVLSKKQFGLALFWILNGLIKKVFLADFLATQFIDRVFDDPMRYGGFENLSALYGYSLQVYADFSGYTDIAIGIALLLGFYLPKNFDSPYKAVDCGNFWRRWHISLSSWLKDYLYIPMGGNRGGSLFTFIALFSIVLFVSMLAGNLWIFVVFVGFVILVAGIAQSIPKFKGWLTTNINIMLTMLIGGLWHGASWNFVIWGAMNGIGIIFYKLWRKISPWENKNKWLNRVWGIFLTFNFITFTRIWFRSGSHTSWNDLDDVHDILGELGSAHTMLGKIFTEMQIDIAPAIMAEFKWFFLVMLFGYIIHWLPSRWKRWYRVRFIQTPILAKFGICFLVIFMLYQVMVTGMHPFIYFQF